MPECHFLTPTQLANMQAQGYALLGGPFNSQAICLANCGSSSSSSSSSSAASSSQGPITVDCCPSNPISPTLPVHIAFSCPGGPEDAFFDINYNGTIWTGDSTHNGTPIRVEFTCDTGGPFGCFDFHIWLYCDGGLVAEWTLFDIAFCSCDPFTVATLSKSFDCAGCTGGNVTVGFEP